MIASRALATGVSLLAVGCSAVLAADWPQFRGPTRDGMSPERGINSRWRDKAPAELWRVPLRDSGYAGPAVAAGVVYIIDHEGQRDVVRALDLATGEEHWRFAYDEPGEERYGYARATPAIEGDRIYTISRSGRVHCLDTAGKLLWTRPMLEEMKGQQPRWGVGQSPLIDGDKLIVAGGAADACIVALDKSSGKTLWAGGDDRLAYSTPVIATVNDVRQYLVFSATRVQGMSPETGAVLWTFPWPTKYGTNVSAPIQVGRGAVYIASGYKTGCAVIDVGRKVTARWKNKEIPAHFNSAVLHNGYLYGTGDPGNLVCLDPRTGETTWKEGGFEKGGLCAAAGTLIVMSGNTGAIAMVEMTPKAYRELGRIQAFEDTNCWAPPIVADRKLIVRSRDQLACFDLRR